METEENEQFVDFPISGVPDDLRDQVVSREEICEPVNECVILQEDLAEVTVGHEMVETQVAVLTEHSDEEEEHPVIYPIYIKEEDHQPYTSGDDESMAVEALRQLGGMYPAYEDKKVTCQNCSNTFTQAEMTKHKTNCPSQKFTCNTCGENFERKVDLNNHMVCHQVDRPHACRTCGNLFRSKAILHAHMVEVHQVERPHKCTICGSDFQRPSSLSNHMKIHTYVAGRALMQANNIASNVEAFTHDSSVASTSVQTVHNFELPQVQWAVQTYNFQTDNTSGLNNQNEKLDTLQEFTVMPNGEVAQFEYANEAGIDAQIGQQYSLTLNSFGNSETLVKVEATPFNSDDQRRYVDVEMEDSRTHTCNQCGVSFARASALTIHEKTHLPKNCSTPVQCKSCDKQFQDGNQLSNHQITCVKKNMQNSEQGETNNKWGKHSCSECGKSFTTKQKMFRHQWIHRKKTHSCEVCGTQFEKQNQLDEHRLSAHPGDSPHTCPECGKCFVSRQGLWEHGRTHAGSPAHFHCDECTKTFSSRQGYLIHHRTHTGERPYGCRYCWKAFRDGGTLRKHERIHTGERPHICPLCSRAFNQKVVLREHVRWVHAAGKNETESTGPPFPCPLCSALNQDRDELCAHIVQHSDQIIAAAKAKTNASVPKKAPKKKTKSQGKSKTKQTKAENKERVFDSEQHEAVISISADRTVSDQPMTITHQNNTVLIVTGKENDTMCIISGDKQSNVKEDSDNNHNESIDLIAIGKNQISNELVSSRDEETISAVISHNLLSSNTMHLIPFTKSGETVHLISNKQNNTLHLISKQNENLPVLTLPNPESEETFSEQISHISNSESSMNISHNMEDENSTEKALSPETIFVDGDALKSAIIQVEYEGEEVEDSDESEEMVCGICGDDFDDKNVLMEHVKIHI